MQKIIIFSIIAVLLVLHPVWCDREDFEDSRNRHWSHHSHPRPSEPSPGDILFGEDYGWIYHRDEGFWYHPESIWRWHPNYGWKQYSQGNNNDNYNE
ncbi:uncharacterized protein LOC132918567 [Rhopalosiphum padi]|uniref:uncharacterized protein LOC132918567 n=1 Tax=Rhopalosiphum padi TaxID=40932 RepID=UPI00298E1BB4|nr:uncharacterized protein LOC132918567 [Rhopalosiphum padi]